MYMEIPTAGSPVPNAFPIPNLHMKVINKTQRSVLLIIDHK